MNRHRSLVAALAALVVVGACQAGSASESSSSATSATSAPASTTSTTPPPAALSAEAPSIVTTTEHVDPPDSSTTTQPTYSAVISEINSEIAARMSESWKSGCPLGLDGLRYLELSHWDYSGAVVTGQLVVASEAAEDIADVFGTLFEAGFPIQRMHLVDEYQADDDLSMAANNTSAFNCREVAWRPGVWSVHSLGLAIDINPLVNPYVSTSRLLPPEGAEYADRSLNAAGLIRPDDVVVQAFADIGWTWGGYWSSAKDYQHFSRTGT